MCLYFNNTTFNINILNFEINIMGINFSTFQMEEMAQKGHKTQKYIYTIFGNNISASENLLERFLQLPFTLSQNVLSMCVAGYLSIYLCMWQYDDWSIGFMCWSLIGQNKSILQSFADVMVAPGGCTVQ